jgi:hypothetical protein
MVTAPLAHFHDEEQPGTEESSGYRERAPAVLEAASAGSSAAPLLASAAPASSRVHFVGAWNLILTSSSTTTTESQTSTLRANAGEAAPRPLGGLLVAADLDMPADSLPASLEVQATTSNGGANVAPSAGVLVDLESDALAAARDQVFAQGLEPADALQPDNLSSWLTAALALAACEIARRQFLRATREERVRIAAPRAIWLPGGDEP